MLQVIWKNRYNLIWHNESEDAINLSMIVFHNWQDWFKAQVEQDIENAFHHILNWNPPSKGWLKCNVDASFNKQRGTTNMGWYVRDNVGNFIFAGVAWDFGTLTILEAEATTLRVCLAQRRS